MRGYDYKNWRLETLSKCKFSKILKRPKKLLELYQKMIENCSHSVNFHLESDTRIIVTQHWTQNLKHIFPEMKLSGLVPNFYIHVFQSDLYIPTIVLIWDLYFAVFRERTLGSTAVEETRAGSSR